jgi:hypothetical protein
MARFAQWGCDLNALRSGCDLHTLENWINLAMGDDQILTSPILWEKPKMVPRNYASSVNDSEMFAALYISLQSATTPGNHSLNDQIRTVTCMLVRLITKRQCSLRPER